MCQVKLYYLKRKKNTSSVLSLIYLQNCNRIQHLFSLLWSSLRPISIRKHTDYSAYTTDLSTSYSLRGLISLRYGISYLGGGFTLRCLQRLSLPNLASRPCSWHCNRSTSGSSIPVLSY